jgi:hypothetical protein
VEPFAALLAPLIGRPDRPPAALLERHPELRQARVRRGGVLPRLGGWLLGRRTVSGITLWRTIWLAPEAPWAAELLLHELRHVQQFHEHATFPIRYIWESVRRGYRRNRYEVDARAWAALRVRTAGRPSHPSEDA